MILCRRLAISTGRKFAVSFCARRVDPKSSAGHDIHELPSGGRDPLSYDDPLRQITRMIQKFPKPIISMVEGSVWGGAFEMIMSSDLIIAASTSTFSMTPVNLGVPYNLVGIHNLTRDAGFHIVKELIFTASPITAQRALAVGILNHVVEVEELEDFTLQMAHHISESAVSHCRYQRRAACTGRSAHHELR